MSRGSSKTLTIVAIADSHEWHRQLQIPACDLLVHAGDASYLSLRPTSIQDFDAWLGEAPARHTLFVPGNHDYFASPGNRRARELHNAKVLTNQAIEIMGLRIWGSPVTPLTGVAFGVPSAEERSRVYSQIPDGVDVLITHCPPFGLLDSTDGGRTHAGCRELLKAVERVKPKVHIFGHAHGARGNVEIGSTTFMNVTVLDATGGLLQPMAFRLRRG